MGDEKQARHVLAEMQARLARSAYDALDVREGDVGPGEVRTAFFELAKTYHPQKFARMSPEIQRLANEVFLGLRAAHDQLSRVKVRRPTDRMLALSVKTPAPELTNRPPAAGGAPSWRQGSGAGRNAPPPPSPAITPSTQVRGSGPMPVQRPSPPPAAPPVQPKGNPAPPPSPSINAPTQRGSSPAINSRPATSPSGPQRRVTPPGGVPIPSSGPRPVVAATRPTPSGAMPAARPSSPPTPATPSVKIEPELVAVYDFLEAGEWERARATLNKLIAIEQRPRYQALLHYVQAREAQIANDIRGAQIELNSALTIDKGLQIAKDALAELYGRRK